MEIAVANPIVPLVVVNLCSSGATGSHPLLFVEWDGPVAAITPKNVPSSTHQASTWTSRTRIRFLASGMSSHLTAFFLLGFVFRRKPVAVNQSRTP